MNDNSTNSNEYKRIHHLVNQTWGQVMECEWCNSTTAKRYEWALLHGKSMDLTRENWARLCKSCHLKYDMTDRQLSALEKGRNDPDAHRKQGLAMKEIWRSEDIRKSRLSKIHSKAVCSVCGWESNPGNVAIHKRRVHEL